MPDGSISMRACGQDDQLAPHNLFFQHSSACVLTFSGGTPTIAYNYNVISAARQSAGTFDIVMEPFDYYSVTPVYPLFPLAFFGSTVGLGMGVAVRVMDNTKVRVYTQVLTTGALADPANTDLIHFVCWGRRLNQGQTSFTCFKTMAYNMGVSGWDGT